MTRIVAGHARRPADRRAARRRHPADLRPGPGGAVQRLQADGRPGRRPLRRPVRRLRRGRAGGAVPGRRARAAGRVRPAGRPGDPGEHRRPARRPGRPAGHRQGGARCSPPARTAARTTWSSPTRRTPCRTRRSPRCWPRWSTAAGWRRTPLVVVERSSRTGPVELGGRHHCASAAAVTARPLFGTVADHETCGLSRLVRPGHQRPPRHHRPGQPALRRGDRRRAGQPVEERPVHRRGADRRCSAR